MQQPIRIKLGFVFFLGFGPQLMDLFCMALGPRVVGILAVVVAHCQSAFAVFAV